MIYAYEWDWDNYVAEQLKNQKTVQLKQKLPNIGLKRNCYIKNGEGFQERKNEQAEWEDCHVFSCKGSYSIIYNQLCLVSTVQKKCSINGKNGIAVSWDTGMHFEPCYVPKK